MKKVKSFGEFLNEGRWDNFWFPDNHWIFGIMWFKHIIDGMKLKDEEYDPSQYVRSTPAYDVLMKKSPKEIKEASKILKKYGVYDRMVKFELIFSIALALSAKEKGLSDKVTWPGSNDLMDFDQAWYLVVDWSFGSAKGEIEKFSQLDHKGFIDFVEKKKSNV